MKRFRYTPLTLEKYIPLEEKDNRKTLMNVFHFDKYLADEFHEISDKYSVVLANYFIDYLSNKQSINSITKDIVDNFVNLLILFNKKRLKDENLIQQFSKALSKAFTRLSSEIKEDLRYIRDWLKGRGQRPNPDEPSNLDLKNLHYNEAMNYAKDWHDYLKQSSEGLSLETGKIVVTYKDGFYWVDLETSYCDKEGEAMGHCGRSNYSNNGRMFSLRNPHHAPVVTIDIDMSRKAIGQCKGRGNTKPKDKYHKYIIDFILNNPVVKLKSSDLSEQYYGKDFLFSDLKDNDFKKIVKDRPELLSLTDKLKAYNKDLIGDKFLKELFDDDKCKFKNDQIRIELQDGWLGDDIETFFTKDGIKTLRYVWSESGGDIYEDFWETGYTKTSEKIEFLDNAINNKNLKELQKIFPDIDLSEDIDELEEKWGEDAIDELGLLTNRAIESAMKDDYYTYATKQIRSAVEERFRIEETNLEDVTLVFEDVNNLLTYWSDEPEYIKDEATIYVISEYLSSGDDLIEPYIDDRYIPYSDDDVFNEIFKEYIYDLEEYKPSKQKIKKEKEAGQEFMFGENSIGVKRR